MFHRRWLLPAGATTELCLVLRLEYYDDTLAACPRKFLESRPVFTRRIQLQLAALQRSQRRMIFQQVVNSLNYLLERASFDYKAGRESSERWIVVTARGDNLKLVSFIRCRLTSMETGQRRVRLSARSPTRNHVRRGTKDQTEASLSFESLPLEASRRNSACSSRVRDPWAFYRAVKKRGMRFASANTEIHWTDGTRY